MWSWECRSIGGLLLASLTLFSLVVDNLFVQYTGISAQFTSLLLVVGVVAEIRRQVTAYDVMPQLQQQVASLSGYKSYK